MIRFVLAMIAGTGAVAAADPTTRRPVPDKYTRAAAKEFDLATAADDKDDLQSAIAHYETALAIAPHANTAYNLAEVRRRAYVKDSTSASISLRWDTVELDYRVYFALATESAEKAAAHKLVDKLLHDPVEVTLVARGGLDLEDAFVMVDGAIVVRPGTKHVETKGDASFFTVMMTPGEHAVDVVTSITSMGSRDQLVEPGRPRKLDVAAPPKLPGNVVFGGKYYAYRFQSKTTTLDKVPERVDLAPGHHRFGVLAVMMECPPIAIDVAKAGLTYVYLGANTAEPDCPGTVTQARLDFPP